MKNLGILLFLILFSFCFTETDIYSSDSNYQGPYFPDDSITDYFTPGNIDSIMPNNNTVYESKTRIILLGFEKFQIIQKIIYFNVIFKRIYGNIFPKILILTIHIFNGNLRNLAEEIKTIECPKISKDDEDNIKFNCSNETNLDNIIKVSAYKNYSLVNEDRKNYNDLQTYLTGYANRTIGNIQKENDTIKDFIILQNSTVVVDDQQFYVMGNISENENIKDNEEVTLYIDENENIKEIPCIIKYENQKKNYELSCTPKQSISFHLDNIDGKISNKTLIISMDDRENDFIDIRIPNNDYVKKAVIKD